MVSSTWTSPSSSEARASVCSSSNQVRAPAAEAMKANMRVVACENTMRAQKITKDDMLPASSYVPAGVTEIMKKQGEGWAYLRP